MEVARDNNGDCIFFEQDGGRLCVIHRDAGLEALPSACRHFPRKFLRDPRGTFVSLSHFCPTAAGMLLGEQPLAVVAAYPPLMLDEPIEGLDARDALPPLLRPGVLTDLEGYAAWERAAIAVLACPDVTWQQALDRIEAATERVRAWQPGGVPLARHVESAFAERHATTASHVSLSHEQLATLVGSLAEGGAPEALGVIDDFERRWTDRTGRTFDGCDTAMKNFLAARLFANWIAYQGRGLRSIVQWMRAAAALVRHAMLRRAIEAERDATRDDFVEAVRMADLLLLHTIDTQAFARAIAPIESFDGAQDGRR